jgi:hypothetical protein
MSQVSIVTREMPELRIHHTLNYEFVSYMIMVIFCVGKSTGVTAFCIRHKHIKIHSIIRGGQLAHCEY